MTYTVLERRTDVMKPKLKYAVYLSVMAFLFLFIGWFIPFWFGRWYGYSSKKQWGLFYTIMCEIGNCTTEAGAIRTGAVDFLGTGVTMELFSLPVLATMSFALSLMSVVFGFLLYKKCCTCLRTMHLFMTIVTLQTTAVVFTFITIIVSAVAVALFFKARPMLSVIEFPWSLICYLVGEMFLVSSDILYFMRIRKYLRRKRDPFSSDRGSSSVYSISLQYYPRRNNHPDYGIYDNSRYDLSQGIHMTNAANGTEERFAYEPTPDYDLDIVKRKPTRTNSQYKSKSGFKRIPRRYRHHKEPHQQSSHLESNNVNDYLHSTNQHENSRHALGGGKDNMVLSEYSTSTVHDNNNDNRYLYYMYNGDTVSTVKGSDLNLTKDSHFTVHSIESFDTAFTVEHSRPHHKDHRYAWYEPRDYGSWAYAGQRVPEFTKLD